MPPHISAERTPANNSAEKPIRERQLAAYHEALKYVEGLHVLEIGCGEGIGPSWIAKKAASVLALDYSEKAIGIAQKLYGHCGIQFQLMKVPPIGFPPNSFGAVICFQMIEHLRKPEELVVEINRVLTHGGLALIATVNKDESITRNPYHLHEFTARELERLLKETFDEVKMYGVFGDEMFQRYWHINKKWASNFLRLDVLHLSDRIPREIKGRLFDTTSRFMRWRLKHRDPELCSQITHRNFIFRPHEFNGCLDFFAVCRKSLQ